MQPTTLSEQLRYDEGKQPLIEQAIDLTRKHGADEQEQYFGYKSFATPQMVFSDAFYRGVIIGLNANASKS